MALKKRGSLLLDTMNPINFRNRLHDALQDVRKHCVLRYQKTSKKMKKVRMTVSPLYYWSYTSTDGCEFICSMQVDLASPDMGFISYYAIYPDKDGKYQLILHDETKSCPIAWTVFTNHALKRFAERGLNKKGQNSKHLCQFFLENRSVMRANQIEVLDDEGKVYERQIYMSCDEGVYLGSREEFKNSLDTDHVNEDDETFLRFVCHTFIDIDSMDKIQKAIWSELRSSGSVGEQEFDITDNNGKHYIIKGEPIKILPRN